MTFASNLKTQILLLVDVAYVALLQFAMCICVYKKFMHFIFCALIVYAALQRCCNVCKLADVCLVLCVIFTSCKVLLLLFC